MWKSDSFKLLTRIPTEPYLELLYISHSLSLWLFLIMSYHLRSDLPSGLFFKEFQNKIYIYLFSFPNVLYVSCAYSSITDRSLMLQVGYDKGSHFLDGRLLQGPSLLDDCLPVASGFAGYETPEAGLYARDGARGNWTGAWIGGETDRQQIRGVRKAEVRWHWWLVCDEPPVTSSHIFMYFLIVSLIIIFAVQLKIICGIIYWEGYGTNANGKG
jgi:hypothetical protein